LAVITPAGVTSGGIGIGLAKGAPLTAKAKLTTTITGEFVPIKKH
jgi:hypothetical protein